MDISKIVNNHTIAQIVIGRWTLSFDFSEDLRLMLSDSMILYKRKGNKELVSEWHYNRESYGLEKLIELIEEPVRNSHFNESEGMEIAFDKFSITIPKSSDDDCEYLHVISKKYGVYIYQALALKS